MEKHFLQAFVSLSHAKNVVAFKKLKQHSYREAPAFAASSTDHHKGIRFLAFEELPLMRKQFELDFHSKLLVGILYYELDISVYLAFSIDLCIDTLDGFLGGGKVNTGQL